jgi:catechol 2,3-dioxygenase
MNDVKVALSHLGISVYDFDRMVDFYTRVMGMIISDTDVLPFAPIKIAFLTSNPDDHHQLVIVGGRKPEDIPTDPPHGGSIGSQLFQLSFRLPDLATMRTMKRRRRAAVDGATRHPRDRRGCRHHHRRRQLPGSRLAILCR